MKRLSIRWSLTLWYGFVLTAILVGFSGAVYMLMRHHLLALTDAALAEELADISADVLRCEGPDEFSRELGLRYASHDGYEFQVSTQKGAVLFRSDGLDPRGLPPPVRRHRRHRRSTPASCWMAWDSVRLARKDGLRPCWAARSSRSSSHWRRTNVR